MHSRRSAAVSSLSLVLPHPPLPKPSSSTHTARESRTSPRTPRSSNASTPPILFRIDTVAPRNSTDSWNSSNCDAGEDEIEWEWKPDQIALLTKTLDTLPSHILTPFHGPIPPSNLLDKIARSIAYARGPLEWPHSVRGTRAKLLELARARAKESDSPQNSHAFDIPEEEVLQQTTNIPQKQRLYRQSSMDFLQSEKLKHEDTIDRLSSRLQRADRVIPNPACHPYARSGSRSPSPAPVGHRPYHQNDGFDLNSGTTFDLRSRSSASSLASSANRAPRLRRSTTLISCLPSIQAGVASTCNVTSNSRLRPVESIKRSESFSSPNMNGLGHTLKRAPSFGASSIRSVSSRMSVDDDKEKENSPKKEVKQKDLDVYPSSDEEEKVRSRSRVKKPRTTKRPSSPSDGPGEQQKSISKKASRVSTKSACSTPNSTVRAKKSKARPALSAGLFGAELPNPQQDPTPPAPIPAHAIVPAQLQLPSEMPATPLPVKTLRRVKTTNFPSRPSRRISFGSIAPPVQEETEGGEGTGFGLESAFQMN
ncbi:hypothetical protein BD410DRAFT_837182 [Rickenella mellea]|uniref:Uncharacterized protein n=1 Tax=Rickenella mellea TaxID=50990 RepID=A0A4Y7QFR6_9AGAM|nr:hypothetical protein BD410DRAFT_837182 [Rickenella mellea]